MLSRLIGCLASAVPDGVLAKAIPSDSLLGVLRVGVWERNDRLPDALLQRLGEVELSLRLGSELARAAIVISLSGPMDSLAKDMNDRRSAAPIA